MLYLTVNTYSGESKWLPLEDATALCANDSYWELDATQAPYDEEKMADTIL